MITFPKPNWLMLKQLVMASYVTVLFSCGGGGDHNDNDREPDTFEELTVLSDDHNDNIPVIDAKQGDGQFTIGFPLTGNGNEVEFYLEPRLPEGIEESDVEPIRIYAANLNLLERGRVDCTYQEDHRISCSHPQGATITTAADTVIQTLSGLTPQYSIVMAVCISDDDCTESTTPIELWSGLENEFTDSFSISQFEFSGASPNGSGFYVTPAENEGEFQILLDVAHPSQEYELRIGVVGVNPIRGTDPDNPIISTTTNTDFLENECLDNPYMSERGKVACPMRSTLSCQWKVDSHLECGNIDIVVISTDGDDRPLVDGDTLPVDIYFLAELKAEGQESQYEVLEIELN